MSPAARKIFDEARKLPVREQRLFIEFLLVSLDPPPEGMTEAEWHDDLQRQYEAKLDAIRSEP